MIVLILGSGGREHAIGWKLKMEGVVLHFATGNAGTRLLGENHACDLADNEAIYRLAKEIGADLVVVGPEAPLVNGIVDYLTARGIQTFGPSKEAADLEGSKRFAKDIMAAAGVPTGKLERRLRP